MGQQASQLEHGDLDVDGHVSVKPDLDSDEDNLEPYANRNASPQDIAFSSQVPFSASRNRDAFRTNGRISRSRFERSSASPDPENMKQEAIVEDSDQDRANPTTKSAKKKKTKAKKKQSGAQTKLDTREVGNEEGDNDDNVVKKTKSVNGLPTLEPQSSMDLNGAASSPNDSRPPMGEDRDVINDLATGGEPETDVEELRRQEKRERKERKRARKAAKQAEELRASHQDANHNLGEQEAEGLAHAPSAQLQSGEAEEEPTTNPSNGASRISSQRSRDVPPLTTAAADQYVAGDQIHDDHTDDANQLPTPDEEVLPVLLHDTRAPSPSISVDLAQSAQHTVQTSNRKRKAKGSDTKSRKRRRDHPQPSEEAEEDDDINGVRDDVGAVLGTTDEIMSSHSPTAQPPPDSTAEGSKRPFNEVAREFYTQRYASKSPTSSKNNTKLLVIKPAAVNGVGVDESPSAARLQRQAASTRSSSERYMVKEEQVAEEDLESVDDMDVDAVDEQTESHSVAARNDVQNHDVTMADRGSLPHFGSDDLGVNSDEKQGDEEEITEPQEQSPSPAQHHVPESPLAQPATTGKSKSLRQYGSRTSTGKKRSAKTSYIDRKEEDNIQAFAGLPSPAVVATSRKDKGRTKQTTAPAAAGPSNAPASSSNQRRITSMMTDENGVASSAPERPSNTPKLAPSFTARLPKRVTKMKNPAPENEITGPFTGSEIRNLTEAITKWRENNNLTEHQINEMVQKNPQEAKTSEFWDYVHYACPNRKRQKIINQVRKTHHNFVARATWTKEQHDELAAFYEIHGRNYKLLGKLINRHPDDARDRVRNYVVCGTNRKSDSWSADEEQKLIEVLNEAFARIRLLKANERPDLQGEDDEELVDWTQVSENMGMTRSRLQCRSKWKQLRLRMEGGNIDGKAGRSMEEIVQEARNDFEKMTHKDLFLIAKAIRRSGTIADSRIGWHKLRAAWDAMAKWNRPALMLAWHRLRRAVPDWKLLSVPEIAKHHVDVFKQTNEIHLLPEDEMDLNAEFRDLEHKVNKMIKGAKAPKTPHLAIKSESDDVGRRASTDLGDDEDPEEPAIEPEIDESETGMHGRRDLEAHGDSEDELAAPQSRAKPKSRRLTQKIQPTIEQSPGVYAAGSQIAADSTPVKKKTKTARSTAKPASRARNGCKSKAKQPLSAEKVVDEDDVSSDTDAEDIEDIPAMLPE